MVLNEKNRVKLNELVQMLRNGIITKQDVITSFGVDERTARDMLPEIAKRCPLVSMSDKKGYRIATNTDDIEDAMHAFNENKKRAAEILKRNQPLERFIQEHEGA